MSARDRILDRLRRSAPAAAPSGMPSLGGDAPAKHVDAQVAAMTAALTAAHADVVRVEGPAAPSLAGAIARFCADRGLRSLMLPNGPLPFDPLVDTSTLRVQRFDRPFEAVKDQLFRDTDAGLTVADCAIADTGTLVMASSPEQPRTLSLVPPIHLCVLDLRRIHPTMAAAMRAERWSSGLPTNLIFVSGPSKTADIQQTLAYGAHGPKELVLFLYDGATR